jgi:hypothetical protein
MTISRLDQLYNALDALREIPCEDLSYENLDEIAILEQELCTMDERIRPANFESGV